MFDFALYHQGTWQDGAFPKLGNATHIVNCDQRNDAYQIEPDEAGLFITIGDTAQHGAAPFPAG